MYLPLTLPVNFGPLDYIGYELVPSPYFDLVSLVEFSSTRCISRV